jgi:hypothetical protein
MSAAWGSTKPIEAMPRLWRAWRMWTYLSVGAIFYLYLIHAF